MHHDEVLDLMPELILGQLAESETARIEHHLQSCSSCSLEFEQASAVHSLAASSAEAPPPGLRSRVLDRAFNARQPQAGSVVPDAVSAWLTETGRFRDLIEELETNAPPQVWNAPCIDEYDLSVRDVVCHLIATNSRWLEHLDSSLTAVPETDRGIQARTRAIVDRHRAMPTSATVAEYVSVTSELVTRIERMGANELAQPSNLSSDYSVENYLLLQAFETWTHSDDIRLATGAPEVAPAETHLHTVTGLLDMLVAGVLARSNPIGTSRRYVIELDGPGGRVCDIRVGKESDDAGPPDSVIACGAIEFCKLTAARRDPASFVYTAEGESELAEQLIYSMPSFAGM